MALRWVLFDLNGTLVDTAVMAQPLGDTAADEDLVSAAVDDAIQLAMVVTLTGREAVFKDLVRAGLRRRLRLAGRDPGLADDAIGLMGAMPAFIDAPAALEQLRGVGVGVSIDDFGTGHSSLTRLRHLPVDELKLDRGFLRSTADDADLAVLRATVGLGRDLGLTIVAEGVEDARQLHLLGSLGCDVAQGFLISQPLPPDELIAWNEAFKLRWPALLSDEALELWSDVEADTLSER